MTQAWIKNEFGNVLLKSKDGWHVSYNEALKQHYLSDETALVSESEDYYILYGDHRKQVEALYPSWDKIYQYFYDNRNQQAASSAPITL